MINLIVVGGGEGTYKNLYPVTKSKDPDLGMKIKVIIDVLPKEKLHPKAQEIINSEGIAYVHAADAADRQWKILHNLENMAGVVMTPNQWHLAYTKLFAKFKIPVYVEKPVVTTLSDLAGFLKLAAKHPQLIYAAEYCVDAKALAALASIGFLETDDPRLEYLHIQNCTNYVKEPTYNYLRSFSRRLGRLRTIHGKMLEGEGTAGTADHRQWLLDGVHGGMIRDLSSHLFGVLYDCGLATSDVIGMKVELGRYEHGKPLGTWRKLKNPEEGETYASIEGYFLTPYSTPYFKFEIGKYWHRHERELVLEFEKGQMRLSYERPFLLCVETRYRVMEVFVKADFYPTLAFLDFKRFLEGRGHGHIGRAAAIVRFNEMARKVGLASH